MKEKFLLAKDNSSLSTFKISEYGKITSFSKYFATLTGPAKSGKTLLASRQSNVVFFDFYGSSLIPGGCDVIHISEDNIIGMMENVLFELHQLSRTESKERLIYHDASIHYTLVFDGIEILISKLKQQIDGLEHSVKDIIFPPLGFSHTYLLYLQRWLSTIKLMNFNVILIAPQKIEVDLFKSMSNVDIEIEMSYGLKGTDMGVDRIIHYKVKG